jgi:hypothetical protein
MAIVLVFCGRLEGLRDTFNTAMNKKAGKVKRHCFKTKKRDCPIHGIGNFIIVF